MDGAFAGWGGLQPEAGDADLALVLHPQVWGWGKRIHDEIVRRAFGEPGFAPITILLPPSRTRVRGSRDSASLKTGKLVIGGEKFVRYGRFAP